MTDFIKSPLELFPEENSAFNMKKDAQTESCLNIIHLMNASPIQMDMMKFRPTNIPVASREIIESAIYEPSTENFRIGMIEINERLGDFSTIWRRALGEDIDILIVGIMDDTVKDKPAIMDMLTNAAQTGQAVYLIHQPGHGFNLS